MPNAKPQTSNPKCQHQVFLSLYFTDQESPKHSIRSAPMSLNILKSKIPIQSLFDLLEKNCFNKTDKYYIVDLSVYKKLVLNNELAPYYESIKEHYKKSKQHYVTRPQKYTYFLTVLRHICNCNEVKYTSSISYDHSKHQIKYYIYYA